MSPTDPNQSIHLLPVPGWFFMASIDDLKRRIDLHELCERLGLKRGKGKRANYHSPHHSDKSPSLSVTEDGKSWRDWSADVGGSCVDLVMYVQGCELGDAIRHLHEMYAIPFDPKEPSAPVKKSTVEYIADRCIENPEPAIDYLVGRKISADVAKRAVKAGAVGFNTWTSAKAEPGEAGYGGPAVAFIVRTLNPGHVVAVDLRYLDPTLNGNVKTQCQGEKSGHGWTADLKRLSAAHTVYVVESPINALSIDTANLPGVASFAVRGLMVDHIDWRWAAGKQLILAFDNDEPFPDGHPRAGFRPGPDAAWRLHEILLGLNISALLIDQSDWEPEINDVNDYLKAKGPGELKLALKRLDQWLIPGLPGDGGKGKSRVYLPGHDFALYYRYRAQADFMRYITKTERSEEDGGDDKPTFADLVGFRVADVSRVTIQSAAATMSGELDAQPRVKFSVSVQVPRHGPELLRRVFEDEHLHNVDKWRRFGPVYNVPAFSRMVNILERTVHMGKRDAVNFVGLAWKQGRLTINEGPDCYFTEPDRQCQYFNLMFPSGSVADARAVIEGYQATFTHNAGTIALVWALGAHFKAILGFWPHLVIQADKGAGKSTFCKSLERSIAFTMLSGQSLQTEFRLVTSVSHTSHPVGWEEISARKQEIIDKAVALLQEGYQWTINRRGAELTEFLISAPVLLAGEDVPVRSLIGKLVRTELTGKKGDLLADNLPRFPVRQWLQFLADLPRERVKATYAEMRALALRHCRASGQDDGATRMVGNYAALLLAWRYLCEFCEIDVNQGSFHVDLLCEMNNHIRETSADREPWVWIVETILSEIAAGNYKHPFKWDGVNGEPALLIRTSHVMDHFSTTPALRDKWNALPVKSDRVFRKQLAQAGIIIDEVARTIGSRRVQHLAALSLEKMEGYGLYATPTADD